MTEETGLLWENQSWDFLNLDSSGGGSDEKSGNKLVDSSTSNTHTPSKNERVVVMVAAGGKKRSKGEGKKNGNEGIKVGIESSDHEVHIWTERERRKKMRTMFSSLHALLPQLPPKADKSTIVDEAVTYIKTLESTVQKLQKQKLERLHSLNSTMTSYDPSSLITPPSKLATETREAFVADQVSKNTGATTNNSTTIICATNSSSSMLLSLPPRFPPIFQSWATKNVILNVCGLDAQICMCSPKKPGILNGICILLDKYKLEVVTAQVSSDNCKSMYMIHTHACWPDHEAFPVVEIYRQVTSEMNFFIDCQLNI